MCRRRESWAAARYSSEVQRGDRPALKLHTPPSPRLCQMPAPHAPPLAYRLAKYMVAKARP
jgi:hypothetical protein